MVDLVKSKLLKSLLLVTNTLIFLIIADIALEGFNYYRFLKGLFFTLLEQQFVYTVNILIILLRWVGVV